MTGYDIWKRFERMYPSFATAEMATGWTSIGLDEIEVMLSDKTRVIYDGIENILIFPDRGDLSDEEVWVREFARRLKKRLFIRGISQSQVAEYCGVSQPTVSKWLNGKSTPDLYMLTRLAELIGCTTDDLIEYEY